MECLETGMCNLFVIGPGANLVLKLPLALLGLLHGIHETSVGVLLLHLPVSIHDQLVPLARLLAQLAGALALASLLLLLLTTLLLTSCLHHFYQNSRKNAQRPATKEAGQEAGQEEQKGSRVVHETVHTIDQTCIDCPSIDCTDCKGGQDLQDLLCRPCIQAHCDHIENRRL
jgi:hypothetical protein